MLKRNNKTEANMQSLQKLTEKWQPIVKAWESSGLSVPQYAKQHQLSKDSLYKWAKHFGIHFQSPAAPEGVPLKFMELPSFPLSLEEQVAVEITFPQGESIKTTAPWLRVIDLVKALRC